MVCLVSLGLSLTLTLISSQVMADEGQALPKNRKKILLKKNEAVSE